MVPIPTLFLPGGSSWFALFPAWGSPFPPPPLLLIPARGTQDLVTCFSEHPGSGGHQSLRASVDLVDQAQPELTPTPWIMLPPHFFTEGLTFLYWGPHFPTPFRYWGSCTLNSWSGIFFPNYKYSVSLSFRHSYRSFPFSELNPPTTNEEFKMKKFGIWGFLLRWMQELATKETKWFSTFNMCQECYIFLFHLCFTTTVEVLSLSREIK